jgi:hypothetical protein
MIVEKPSVALLTGANWKGVQIAAIHWLRGICAINNML